MLTDMLTDIHTHHLPQAEILAIFNIRINQQKFELVQEENLYYSAGIHPWDAHKVDDIMLQNLEQCLQNEDVVAIGECGLDKFAEADYSQQEALFLLQIQYAENLAKPLIIHCVKYFNELMQLRKKHQPKQAWIVHGFRGKPQLAEELIKADFYLSFGENFNPEAVKTCPLNRLLIETDESKLPLEEIYLEIAKCKKLNINDLARNTQNNLRDILATTHTTSLENKF